MAESRAHRAPKRRQRERRAVQSHFPLTLSEVGFQPSRRRRSATESITSPTPSDHVLSTLSLSELVTMRTPGREGDIADTGGDGACSPAGRAQPCELMGALHLVRPITLTYTPWLQRRPHLPGGEPCTTGIMERYRERISTFFAGLANALGAKQRPLSKSLGPPGPQTCRSTSSRISSSG